MSSFCKFKIGQLVTHSDIIAEFQCGNMGGMRRSNIMLPGSETPAGKK
jgi:5-methylcytosine-specific restriction protein A